MYYNSHHATGRAAQSSLTGLTAVQPFLQDLPAVPELDSLFAPAGPILDAQKQSAELFGAAEIDMVFSYAYNMSDSSSNYGNLFTTRYIISSTLRKQSKSWKPKDESQKPSAVLITSPTYHGICSNLMEISLLCHSHNVPLIVDEAHGAHLGFHQNLPRSALSQGADISLQSTHKVLGSFQQSSMLHMSRKIVNKERICQCLQTLQSTSPSYLLLASLNAARTQISENPQTIFNKPIELSTEAKDLKENITGITVLKSDNPNYSWGVEASFVYLVLKLTISYIKMEWLQSFRVLVLLCLS
ncbi:arginine decarboxylase [Artemisia annua]|uniref:Arginine decarboxylase n=1 Tax=Artemisia annua TaxID=35608 RepID=A0A2U1MXP1_ARTAN|nr:arginine decarboxylase [Artemisia annua]